MIGGASGSTFTFGDDVDEFVQITETSPGVATVAVDLNGTTGGTNFVDAGVILGFHSGDIVTALVPGGSGATDFIEVL